MAWLTVEINDELQGRPTTDHRGEEAVDPSVYADVLESVTVENVTSAEFQCSLCSAGFETADDAEGMECNNPDVCDDIECPCDWSTDHPPAHKLVPAPLAWFENAAVRVSEGEDSVVVSLSAGDPRGAFALEIRRIPDDAENNAGQLIMYLPHEDMSTPHMSLKRLNDGAFILGS